MIDVEKIVGEAVKHAESLHDNTFYPLDKDGMELMGQHRLEREQESARRAVALTLRAVAARCAELALHNYDNMEGCSTAEEIDKWSTCMGMASDLMDELISQAAAIEKGGCGPRVVESPPDRPFQLKTGLKELPPMR